MNKAAFYTQKLLLLSIFSFISFVSIQAQPAPCGIPPAMASTCFDACVICDIDGFTGRNNQNVQGQTFDGFCTTFHHNTSYIAFIAGTENLTIDVTVSNCTINRGLEIGIFRSDDCETFTAVTFCDTDVSPNTTVSFSNTTPLIIGQHYYLIMDGSNGDVCDWTFNVTDGSTAIGDLTSSGTINGETTTCPDLPTTYSTTGEQGATFYYWTVDGVTQPSLEQEIDITFPADGTYELCVRAANVCDDAPPTCTTIEVVTSETLVINETLCENECLNVAGETLCATGIYEFVLPLPNGCDSTIFVDLEILPQASSFIDINLCVGEEFLIGNTPYANTGVFLDTILTAAACDSIVTLDLFMIECEIIGSTQFIEPICHGESNGALLFSVENGTPPFNYDWSNILDPAIGGTGTTNLLINNIIENVPAGTYEININDNFGNDVVLFQTVSEPSILSVETEAVDLNGFNLSCFDGSDGTASAQGNGGMPPYTFGWSDNQTGSTINNLAAGSYTVFITDAKGCVRSNDIILTQPSPIEFIVDFINPNCDGLETGVIQLDSIWGGTPPYSYTLNDGSFSTIDNYTDLGSGTYNFSMMDANTCLTDTSASLNAPDIPVLFMGEELTVDLGCDILLPVTTNNTNLTQINWTSLVPSLDCDTCLQPLAKPFNDTEYLLMVTSIDDCTTSDSIHVSVNKNRDIYAPNIFSPNDDGVNDRFSLSANKSVSSIQNFKIFSRWGELVFEANDILTNQTQIGWDGFFRGEKMQGIFIWTAEVEYLDGEILQLSGDVMLIL